MIEPPPTTTGTFNWIWIKWLYNLWEEVRTGSGAVEGADVLSTGEVGGSKFLREDGDGTSSWQAIGGGGDMLAANNLSDLIDDPTARANLGVDAAGTDNSTDVTLTGTGTYISIAGQAITVDPITESDISDLQAYGDVLSTGTPLDNQIATWTAADTIEGNAGITFDSATDTFTLLSATTPSLVIESASGATIKDIIFTGNSLNEARVYQSSASKFLHLQHLAPNQTSITAEFRLKQSGDIEVLTGGSNGVDAQTNVTFSGLGASTAATTFASAAITSASTTTRAGLNVPEGTAPSAPNDGDVWVTAAGAFNARLNGVTVDLSASGSGDMLSTNNLSDVANASTSRTNLGVAIGTNVQAHAPVLDATTASFLTADETKLDGIEALADVTDTANVTSAGALMDSEVDADIKTLVLPASTTISAFGATLTDDADAATARTTLSVDVAGTDNSTDVTLAGQDYLTLSTQQITANKIAIDDLADGTDGELITWSATGVAAVVAVGTSGHVLTSNGVGAAPTFQASGGGGFNVNPASFSVSGSHDITTTESTIVFDTEDFDPDTNYSNASGEITVTDAGYYYVSVNVPINDDGTGGAARGRVFGFLQRDQTTSTWITVNNIRGQDYHRETSGGSGLHAAGIVSLSANELIRFRIDVSSSTDVSTESGECCLNIHKIRET